MKKEKLCNFMEQSVGDLWASWSLEKDLKFQFGYIDLNPIHTISYCLKWQNNGFYQQKLI